MDYAGNTVALAQYAGDSALATDADFLAQLPVFIQSAELRILRDLDLISTRVEDDTGALTPNRRLFTLPTDTGSFELVTTARLIINGIYQPPLLPLSIEVLDTIYPDERAVGVPSIPKYWAPFNATQILVGPAPGIAYGMAVYGPQTPKTLSSTNTTTWISINLPDLFLAAEMILVSGWQRLFSAMSDDPAQARDWNQEYERLKGQQDVQELRRKVQGSGWGTRQPNSIAASTTA